VVQLRNVSWTAFLELLGPATIHSGRFAYQNGVLEIISPGRSHEIIADLFKLLVAQFALHHDIPILSTGSVTCKDERLQASVEADASFFIAREPLVTDKSGRDAADGLHPALAIEVDVTKASMDKLPIYAALGIPEVWRWSDSGLEVLCLGDGAFSLVTQSRALPEFPLEQIGVAIGRLEEGDSATAILRAFNDSLTTE